MYNYTIIKETEKAYLIEFNAYKGEKEELIKLLGWYAAIKTQHTQSIGKFGKYLEKIRFSSEKTTSDIESKLFNSYLVYEFVESEYKKGKDIFEFRDFNINDVRKYILENYNNKVSMDSYL